jgi:hypothetical protein
VIEEPVAAGERELVSEFIEDEIARDNAGGLLSPTGYVFAGVNWLNL